MQLEIIIPTYNRKKQLDKNLSHIYRQKKEYFRVTVIDNCSTEFNYFENKIFLEKTYPEIKVMQNVSNLGLAGNILKALEIAETEWVWILGDDDYVNSGAIEKIFSLCSSNPEYSYININCKGLVQNRNLTYKTSGVTEFIEKLDSFYNLLFISSGVYNVKLYKPFLKYGYLYCYTLAPHVAILLTSLNESSSCLFIKEVLFENSDVTDDSNERWSDIPLQLSLMTLLELPIEIDDKTFNKFAFHLETHIKRPGYNFKVLIWYPEFNSKHHQLIYIFSQIFKRTYLMKKKFTNKLSFTFFGFLVKLNTLSYVKKMYFLFGKPNKIFSRYIRI